MCQRSVSRSNTITTFSEAARGPAEQQRRSEAALQLFNKSFPRDCPRGVARATHANRVAFAELLQLELVGLRSSASPARRRWSFCTNRVSCTLSSWNALPYATIQLRTSCRARTVLFREAYEAAMRRFQSGHGEEHDRVGKVKTINYITSELSAGWRNGNKSQERPICVVVYRSVKRESATTTC